MHSTKAPPTHIRRSAIGSGQPACLLAVVRSMRAVRRARARCSRTVPVGGKRGRAREFAPGGIRRGSAGVTEAAGSRDSRLRSGDAPLSFSGPRWGSRGAVGRSRLRQLSENLVSPHVSPIGPVDSVAVLPDEPLKGLCPSSPADKPQVLRN